jgi:BTB/POZ domain-containing protein
MRLMNLDLIPCHKVVLSTCSPVLEVMLKSDMKEAMESNLEIVDMSLKALKLMVFLLYSIKPAGKKISAFELAFELMKAGDK